MMIEPVIAAYQRLLKGKSVYDISLERALSLECALLKSLGFPLDAEQAASIFWQKFKTVSLPLAARLTDIDQGADLWRILGARNRQEQLAAVAVIMSLRYSDSMLGKLYTSRYTRLLGAFYAPGADLTGVGFSKDGTLIHAVDRSGGTWVWELDSGCLSQWPDPNPKAPLRVDPARQSQLTATSEDEHWIANADATSLRIASLDKNWKRPVITIDVERHPLKSLAFSPPQPLKKASKKTQVEATERLWVGSLAGAGGEWVQLWRLDPPVAAASGPSDQSSYTSHRQKNWIQRSRSKLDRRMRDLVMYENAGQWSLIGGQSDDLSSFAKGVVTALSLLAREVLTFGLLHSHWSTLETERCPFLKALGAWLKSRLKGTLQAQYEATPEPASNDDGEDHDLTPDEQNWVNDHQRERLHIIASAREANRKAKSGRSGMDEGDDIEDDDTDETSETSEGLVASYSYKNEVIRESLDLLPFRSQLLRLEPLLRDTLAEMEPAESEKDAHRTKVAEAVITNDGKPTSFWCYCRIRFAAQLWGYCSEEKYKARDRVKLAESLETVFSRTDDPDTSNALEVLGSCRDLTKAKSLWGDSYDKKLAELLGRVASKNRPELCPLPWPEIAAGLARLRELKCDLAMPDGFTDDVARALELYESVLRQQQYYENLSLNAFGPGPSAAFACQTEMATLAANLVDLLASRPLSALERIRARLAPLYPRHPPPSGLGSAAFDQLRADVAERLWDHLINTGYMEGTGLSADDPRWTLRAAQKALDALIAKIRLVDPEELLHRETPDTEFSTARIKGFFSQHYSPNQVEGVRTWRPDEWEYLAYRLAHRPEFPAYGRIWARVSAGCPLPSDSDIRRLYRFLLMDPELIERLEAGLRDCFAANDEATDL